MHSSYYYHMLLQAWYYICDSQSLRSGDFFSQPLSSQCCAAMTVINCAVLVVGGDTTEGREFFRNVINDSGVAFKIFDQTNLLQDQEIGYRSRYQQDGTCPSTQLSVFAQTRCVEAVTRMVRWALDEAKRVEDGDHVGLACADGLHLGLATVPVSRCSRGWHRSSTIAYMFAKL